MDSPLEPREIEFNVGQLTLRAKRWGAGNKPVIALHGWLDNCASYDFLAPKLHELDIVALDLAGQGRSEHRPVFGAYNIWQDVIEIIAVCDQLGWDSFGVLGHSRGAMIATLVAGTFPQRVSDLALIESFIPTIQKAEQSPSQLASSINFVLKAAGKKRSSYDTYRKAVAAREKGMLKLDYEDAAALAERGVVCVDDRYGWNHDIKLTAPSEVRFTVDQARAFVDQIAVPIELIRASEGLMVELKHLQDFIALTPNMAVRDLNGGHHLHMSTHSQEVAEYLNAYFHR